MTDQPDRLQPGDLLAALGDLSPGRAAEAYAALGYRVVAMHAARADGGCTCRQGTRCADPGKHPCLADWPRVASTTPAEVRRWWQRWPAANVGLVTGTRFDVLDLDGQEGVEALRAILGHHPAEHVGPVVRTGGDGWHLLYAPTGLGNRVGLLPGVDWRGRGGVIVAPPSVHASGRAYRWVRPLSAELPPVPDRLRARLAPPRTQRTTGPPPPPAAVAGGRAERYARAALDREAHAVATAPAGTCNHTLNRAAFNLGQLVAAGLLDAEQVRAVLLEVALAAPATGQPTGSARPARRSSPGFAPAPTRRAGGGGGVTNHRHTPDLDRDGVPWPAEPPPEAGDPAPLAGGGGNARLPRHRHEAARRGRAEPGAPLLAELHAALRRYVVLPSPEAADAVKGDRLEALYVLALTTGMREGELFGLRWADVNLDACALHLVKQLKTSTSRRQVLLVSVAVEALSTHRIRQDNERHQLGAAWDDQDLVFPNTVVRPLHPRNFLRRSFYPLLDRAGLPRIRFHDLRHSAATLLLGLGIHPKIVSELLGHSQVGITLDLYSHVTATMQQEAVRAFEGLLGSQLGSQPGDIKKRNRS